VDWSLRACARKGHITYAPTEDDLCERLHATTVAGVAWRCLRCGDFVVGEPHGTGPAEDAPLVLRGRALRDALILRLLAVERLVRALILLAIAYGIVRFRAAQAGLRATFDRALPAAKPLERALHVDLTDSPLVARIHSVLESRQHTLTVLAVAFVAYAALQLLEGVGLFLLTRWGEYVAAVGTAALLPVEVHEILARFTIPRLLALLVNIAAVVYLLLTKRLFGLRGGRAAFERERHSASLLEVEQAAVAAARPVDA
jgi:uncharacterized membrane protein (DUF2068 family)